MRFLKLIRFIMITNIKKTILIVLLVILSSCQRVKRTDFYVLNIGEDSIVVGYDDETFIKDYLDEYEINEEGYIDKIVLYLKDVDEDISIDDYLLNKGIEETCGDLEGEYLEKNGHVCLISKRVNRHDNYVLLYGDILSDDLDKIDRVEVYYK